MEVLIFPNAQSLARKSADLVESQIKAFPDSVIGWQRAHALGLYQELIQRHNEYG